MSLLILLFLLCSTTVSSKDLSLLEHYCYVQSPHDFTSFNLSTLQNDAFDSILRLNDLEYLRVHFCGPLRSPCNGKPDYAICLHSELTSDKEVGIGREPPKVAVESGKIILRYKGDKCNNTHNYTVDIEMKCNFSMKETVGPNIDTLYKRNECGFQITLPTTAACAKGIQTTCDLKNEMGYFNLKPLMELTSNYIINLNQNLSVILNVCHSLIYGQHFSECNHDTMICLVDETNAAKPSFTRLGNINNDVRITASAGSVFLELTSDTPCDKQDAELMRTVWTTIEFVCKENATNKLPQYTSGYGSCHYKFTWLTAVACSEDMLIQQSEANHQPCKITDPVYNKLFDLSMLEGAVESVKSDDETAEYQFSVCRPLQNSSCTKEGTGVCKYIKDQNVSVSKGLANTNLMWRRNHILLNYTDGIACGNYQRSFTTIIFKCEGHNFTQVLGVPDPCATIIIWNTPLICEHRCATSDYEFNFNYMRHGHSNYVVPGETPGTTYYLNVCEPLLDYRYTGNCTYGTGVCKVVVNENGTRISEINLGYAENGLRTAPDGRMYLSHVNGSVCEEDPSKRISSEITFTCDQEFGAVDHLFLIISDDFFTSLTFARYIDMQDGVRSFGGYHNCKYNFIWKSRRVCPKNMHYFTEECVVKEKIKKFNLQLLIDNYRFKLNPNESAGYFNGSACGDLSKCHGTFACDHYNYTHKNRRNLIPKLNRLPKLVAFQFENKTECKNESFIHSWLTVWCGIHRGTVESFLVKEEECSIGLDWDNSTSVCEFNDNGGGGGGGEIAILIIVAVVILILIIVALCFFRRRERGIICVHAVRNAMARYMRYMRLIRAVAEEDDDEEDDDDIAMQ